MNFRADINALRAVAVSFVVLYHFDILGFGNGFVGVDIFFVISGYLMTAIICADPSSFDYRSFLASRLRRVFPALLVLGLVLFLLGWLLLPDPQFTELLNEIFYSLTFLSNVFYRWNIDYFGAANNTKWLLHTWSLAVELQFYLIYPAFLIFVAKLAQTLRAKLMVILAVTLISFSAAVYLSALRPDISFYLLPTRIWEFLLGGVAYFISAKKFSENQKLALSYTGFILLFSSLLLSDQAHGWPSHLTLFPTIATTLIIISNRDHSFNNSAFVRWLGLRSYSIYLWHWPVIIFLNYYAVDNVYLYVSYGILATVILSELSYKFVEGFRFKKIKSGPIRTLLSFLFIVLSVSFIFSVKVFDVEKVQRSANASQTAQYLSNYSRKSYLPLIGDDYLNQCNFYDDIDGLYAKQNIDQSCFSLTSKSVLLLGDSHAQALSLGIRTILEDSGFEFSQITSSGCKPGSVTFMPRYEIQHACNTANIVAQDYIARVKPALVILAQQDSHEKTSLYKFGKGLLAKGVKKVLIIGPVPQWTIDLPNILVQKYWGKSERLYINHKSFRFELFETDKIMLKLVSPSGIEYISLLEVLCVDKMRCLATVDNQLTPLVWDQGHLTKQGSLYVANEILLQHLNNSLENM